jgi:uncharacterized membrane protein YphA (DoxX/SURF4 family)
MKIHRLAYHILRIGLAITFLWIGFLIFMEPEVWGGFIQPWVVELLPVSVKVAMLGTALLDVAVGALLLLNLFTWLAVGVGALHLVIVLITSGFNSVTVRDVGLFAGSAALAFEAWSNRGNK